MQRSSPDLASDSKQLLLPLEAPAIEAIRELFLPEEEDKPADIIKIIQTCLEDIVKSNPKHAIKTLLQLISVSEYIKLHAHYKISKACKQPCLKASIAVARWIGKGPYFACQI